MDMPNMTFPFRIAVWVLFACNIGVNLANKNYPAVTGWAMAVWASSNWAFLKEKK